MAICSEVDINDVDWSIVKPLNNRGRDSSAAGPAGCRQGVCRFRAHAGLHRKTMAPANPGKTSTRSSVASSYAEYGLDPTLEQAHQRHFGFVSAGVAQNSNGVNHLEFTRAFEEPMQFVVGLLRSDVGHCLRVSLLFFWGCQLDTT